MMPDLGADEKGLLRPRIVIFYGRTGPLLAARKVL